MNNNITDISTEEIVKIYEGPRETDPFDGGVTAPVTGHDRASKAAFYSLEDSDIRALHKAIDRESVEYINQCHASGLISEAGAEHLLTYFEDSMAVGGRFYYALLDVLGQPQTRKRNDLAPGEIDDRNYSDTYVTPNNSMVLGYSLAAGDPDLSDNQMYLTWPGMKNVRRAVQKIQKGGKYERQYQKEAAALVAKYPKGTEGYQKELAKLTPPHLRLMDVLRGTISVPTYEEIDKIINKIIASGKFEIAVTKDKFCANRSAVEKDLYDNKKNYRDKKVCFKYDELYFELQFKVQMLEKADLISHPYYEQLRQKLFERNNSDPQDIMKQRQLERQIIWLERTIQQINRQGFNDYNTFIMSVALKKDTRLKKEKLNKLRQQLSRTENKAERLKLQKEIYQTGQSINAQPVMPEAQEFIKRNFMVRPFKAIDKQGEFENAPKEVQNFALLNYFLVSPRYNGAISGRLSADYRLKYEQADQARRQAEKETFQQECRLYRQNRGKNGIVMSRKNYTRS